MPGPFVRVRDLETDEEYLVSEARYKGSPELWERLGPEPAKPKTTVSAEAAKQKAKSGHPADLNQEES